MTKYSFLDDYSEGCHPHILEAMITSNFDQEKAYGQDTHSLQAKAKIKAHLKNNAASIFFVASGTLANLIIIASLLRPHEAVIAPSRGHIAGPEAGAIEALGHKILTVESPDGKLTPDQIEGVLQNHAHVPHMVKPRLIYVSNATETGRIYSKAELKALSAFCQENALLFMLDGARLGSALASHDNDVTLADLSDLTDIFWLGGTKAGALIGEAIIINNWELAEEFEIHIKQRGGLLAKSRLLGLQFNILFENDLFFEAAKFANSQAQKLSKAFLEKGYTLLSPTQANQVFPIVPNTLVARLEKDFDFYIWQSREEDQSVLRLVTAWATDPTQVEAFIQAL